MKALKQWLNKDVKPTTKENTYTPALAVCDEKRKQYFTNYNAELMNQIRKIKLNNNL